MERKRTKESRTADTGRDLEREDIKEDRGKMEEINKIERWQLE